MQQTGNYGLNQWELTDRIRMEDFNGDNAKIEAALKSQAEALAAETAAREAADANLTEQAAALEARAGLQLLKNITLTANCAEYALPLTDIDWDQWKAVHISMEVYASDSCVVNFYANSAYSADSLGNVGGSPQADPAARHAFQHLVLFPLYDKRRQVKVLSFGSNASGSSFYFSPYNTYYEEMNQLLMVCSSDHQIYAGSNIQVWGEK